MFYAHTMSFNDTLLNFDFDPAGGFPPGHQNVSSPTVQVESLSLADLMKNRHVQNMYNKWQEASNQVIQSAQMQQNLWQENSRLTAEVNALQSGNL